MVVGESVSVASQKNLYTTFLAASIYVYRIFGLKQISYNFLPYPPLKTLHFQLSPSYHRSVLTILYATPNPLNPTLKFEIFKSRFSQLEHIGIVQWRFRIWVEVYLRVSPVRLFKVLFQKISLPYSKIWPVMEKTIFINSLYLYHISLKGNKIWWCRGYNKIS